VVLFYIKKPCGETLLNFTFGIFTNKIFLELHIKKGEIFMEKKIVALQLYTVRDFTEKNVAETLRAVKKMGYDYVELAGTYGMEFLEFKKMLDEIGLCAISAHVPFNDLQNDMEGTISAYKTLGCKYIVIPMVDAEFLPGGKNCARDFFEKFCAACEAAAVVPAYHNHAFEFEKLSCGAFKLDKLFSDVPALFAELDTGWITAAGQCPEAYIKKYAERCPIIHLKDTVLVGENKFEDRPVGKGSQNMAGIIETAVSCGAEVFVAELDKAEKITSLEAAEESRNFLKKYF
jgi:sugar phosphate isomerase/epimerase